MINDPLSVGIFVMLGVALTAIVVGAILLNHRARP